MDQLTSTSALRKSSPVVSIKNGRDWELTRKGWHTDGVAHRLLTERKWHTMGEIAKSTYGRDCQANRDRVRGRLYLLRNILTFHHNELLVFDYPEGSRKPSRVKIWDRSLEEDKQKMITMLKAWKERKDKAVKLYEAATGIAVFND